MSYPLVILLLLFWPTSQVAENMMSPTKEDGVIIGRITDYKKKYIDKVLVTVISLHTGKSVEAKVDKQGQFRIDNLRPGKYKVRCGSLYSSHKGDIKNEREEFKISLEIFIREQEKIVDVKYGQIVVVNFELVSSHMYHGYMVSMIRNYKVPKGERTGLSKGNRKQKKPLVDTKYEGVILKSEDIDNIYIPNPYSEVVQMEFDNAEKLSNWLNDKAKEGKALLFAIPIMERKTLFILGDAYTKIAPVYFSVEEQNPLRDEVILAKLVKHKDKKFLGVHILTNSYLIIYQVLKKND